jgi:signal transduction histidine kinase
MSHGLAESQPNNQFIRLPGWLANLLLFGLLIIMVLVAFFWQMAKISDSLQRNAIDRSRMVAGVIEKNLQNATLSGQTIDEIVTSFLHDKASFVEYLDGIEPLHREELAALARETGLIGISLFRSEGRIISEPASWLPAGVNCSLPDGRLYYEQKQQIAYLGHQTKNIEQDLACVIIGLDAGRIIDLQKKNSLPALFQSLSSLPGIDFIHLRDSEPGAEEENSIVLNHGENNLTVVATTKTSLGILEVGLDARYFLQRRNTIRNQFVLFGTLLLALGIFFSWLLYWYQQRNLRQATNFERELAREHEAAALGRATATIAHEVRNPLNAINMGLQRLEIESDNLDQEQEEMIAAMREAVMRTSTIVTELQRFSRDLQPEHKTVRLDLIIRQTLTLYYPACEQQNIIVTSSIDSMLPVIGDPDLLAELVENLLKNGVEAQPAGGFITISARNNKKEQSLIISNGGFTLQNKDRHRPGDPYFTSKIRGSGLGLALCKRIAEAHHGRLTILTGQDETENDTFTVTVSLPTE